MLGTAARSTARLVREFAMPSGRTLSPVLLASGRSPLLAPGLAALNDAAPPLSLAQFQALKRICEAHGARLNARGRSAAALRIGARRGCATRPPGLLTS